MPPVEAVWVHHRPRGLRHLLPTTDSNLVSQMTSSQQLPGESLWELAPRQLACCVAEVRSALPFHSVQLQRMMAPPVAGTMPRGVVLWVQLARVQLAKRHGGGALQAGAATEKVVAVASTSKGAEKRPPTTLLLQQRSAGGHSGRIVAPPSAWPVSKQAAWPVSKKEKRIHIIIGDAVACQQASSLTGQHASKRSRYTSSPVIRRSVEVYELINNCSS